MNDNLGTYGNDGVLQDPSLEDIDNEWFDAAGAQHVRFCWRAGRAHDSMSGIKQERNQSASDRAGRARQQNPITHRNFPSTL